MKNTLLELILANTGIYWCIVNTYKYGKLIGKRENTPTRIAFCLKEGTDINNIKEEDITVEHQVYDGIQWVNPEKTYRLPLYDKNCNTKEMTYNYNQFLKRQQFAANSYKFRALCWFILAICNVFLLTFI